jgi:hypothetical protein
MINPITNIVYEIYICILVTISGRSVDLVYGPLVFDEISSCEIYENDTEIFLNHNLQRNK